MDEINYEVAFGILLQQTKGVLPPLDSWVWINLPAGPTTSALGIKVAELLALALVDISRQRPVAAPAVASEVAALPADSQPVVLAELAGQAAVLLN